MMHEFHFRATKLISPNAILWRLKMILIISNQNISMHFYDYRDARDFNLCARKIA